MLVYRLVKHRERTSDLSGTGSYVQGGRWNSAGVYALYTAQNRSLALLEMRVHFDPEEMPPSLFVMTIEIQDHAPMLELNELDLPYDWRTSDNLALQAMGDEWLKRTDILAIKVPSAVMPLEYNFILNPSFSGYHQMVRVVHIDQYTIDERLN
jgi:RES domain-containing protein